MGCAWCESEDIDVPTVDIGVGEQQVAAAMCGQCGATQIGFLMDADALPEEKQRGWYKGPDTDDYLLHFPEAGEWLTPRAWTHRITGYAPGDLDTFTAGDIVYAHGLLAVVHRCVILGFGRGNRVASALCGAALRIAFEAPAGAATCLGCATRS